MIPRLILFAVLAPGAFIAIRTLWRERHRLPAAPDNQRGTDTGALDTCRQIARQPLVDPDISRRTNDYLRRKEGEQP
ncbi:hypothetical protein ACIPWE_38460 [Streptomyces sp. NPDC090073]|uniref:hypothetical protein n=1 Tax=Streptomyces sp. NPDC090073 TaxID=3365936 RepID=UPI00380572A8